MVVGLASLPSAAGCGVGLRGVAGCLMATTLLTNRNSIELF